MGIPEMCLFLKALELWNTAASGLFCICHAACSNVSACASLNPNFFE
jgi:hypothetical protein